MHKTSSNEEIQLLKTQIEHGQEGEIRAQRHIYHVASQASIVVINQQRPNSADSKWANFHMQSVLLMRQLKGVDRMNHRAKI